MTAGVGWLSCCAERHLEAGSRGSRAGGDETQGGSFGRRSKMNGRGLLIPALLDTGYCTRLVLQQITKEISGPK